MLARLATPLAHVLLAAATGGLRRPRGPALARRRGRHRRGRGRELPRHAPSPAASSAASTRRPRSRRRTCCTPAPASDADGEVVSAGGRVLSVVGARRRPRRRARAGLRRRRRASTRRQPLPQRHRAGRGARRGRRRRHCRGVPAIRPGGWGVRGRADESHARDPQRPRLPLRLHGDARRSGRRSTRSCSSASCGSRCSRPSATSASTCPDGVVEAYEAVVDQVDLDSIARPRAGHPARREGAHRGVLRAGRPRARPQGHDQPRPHRERRAAPGPARRCSWCATRSWPCWPALARLRGRARRRWRWPAARTTSRRRRPRWASASPRAADELLVALDRLEELIARYPLRGIKGPVGTGAGHARPARRRRRQARRARATASPRTSASTHVLTSVGQVYPRSLDFDVVSALVQLGRRPVVVRHHDAADGRQRAGHRGLQAGPGRLLARCRTR